MLQPRGKIIITLILVALAIIGYFIAEKKHIIKTEKNIFDTLSYDKGVYDLMLAYYNSDTAFNRMLHENIEMGDSSAILVKKLLHAPYHLRYKSGLKESDIKEMIHAYLISKKVLDKFADIESQLKEVNAEDSAIQRYLDSLRNLATERKLKKNSN